MTPFIVLVAVIVVGAILSGVALYLKGSSAQRRSIIRNAEERIIRDNNDAFATRVQLRRTANGYKRGSNNEWMWTP